MIIGNEFIGLKDALREMETPIDGIPPRFSVIICEYSKERKTGGQIMELINVRLSGFKSEIKDKIKPEYLREAVNNDHQKKSNPNHSENSTKNFLLPNGQIRKAHIRFILFYNGKQILQ